MAGAIRPETLDPSGTLESGRVRDTGRSNNDEAQRSVSMTVDSLTLIKAARRAGTLWLSGFRYSQAGIITQELVPPASAAGAVRKPGHERATR